MHLINDDSPRASKSLSKKYVSDWIEFPTSGTITIDATSELESVEDVEVTIERQRDGLKLPFNVMSNKGNGTNISKRPERKTWMFVSEPGEKFRYSIESSKDDFDEILDVELEPTLVMAKAIGRIEAIADLQYMMYRKSVSIAESECSVVSISDNPSAGEFRFLVKSIDKTGVNTLVVVASDGSIVQRMELSSDEYQYVRIDLSDCASGLYNVRLLESSCGVQIAVLK